MTNVQTTPADATTQMMRALRVIVLNSEIHRWLIEHDPKALEQAIEALGAYDSMSAEGVDSE